MGSLITIRYRHQRRADVVTVFVYRLLLSIGFFSCVLLSRIAEYKLIGKNAHNDSQWNESLALGSRDKTMTNLFYNRK